MTKILTREEAREMNSFYEFDNGDYSYKDEYGIQHLIRNGEEITKGKSVHSYDNGDYCYGDKDGVYYKFDKDGNPIE